MRRYHSAEAKTRRARFIIVRRPLLLLPSLLFVAACSTAPRATQVTPAAITLPKPQPIAAPAPEPPPPPHADAPVRAFALEPIRDAIVLAGATSVTFTSDGTQLALAVEGERAVLDASTLAVVTNIVPTIPAGCEPRSVTYSADGARFSAQCATDTDDFVQVFDTQSGKVLGVFKEFETAAPIRGAAMSASGNFLFWSARASGAFEEIATHKTGDHESSHSVLSPDDSLFFTTVDRNWLAEDTSRGQILSFRTRREVMTVPSTITTVWFSPSSRYFAALAPATFHDTAGPAVIYSLAVQDVVARLPASDVVAVAFAPDDARIAVLEATSRLTIYALKPLS